MKILTLVRDSDLQNPSEFDGAWKLYSFSRRHRDHENPETFFPNGKPTLAIRRKLEVGTAFLLSYYEHSGSLWSLQGEGPHCQWDTVDMAGILVWEHKPSDMGAKTREARAKDAQGFLDDYNDWANGYGYGYQIEEVVTLPCGHTETNEVDSCYGFYSNQIDYMFENIRDALAGETDVTVKGDAKDVMQSYHLAPVSAPATEH